MHSLPDLQLLSTASRTARASAFAWCTQQQHLATALRKKVGAAAPAWGAWGCHGCWCLQVRIVIVVNNPAGLRPVHAEGLLPNSRQAGAHAHPTRHTPYTDMLTHPLLLFAATTRSTFTHPPTHPPCVLQVVTHQWVERGLSEMTEYSLPDPVSCLEWAGPNLVVGGWRWRWLAPRSNWQRSCPCVTHPH
jgi:hypothetical protein